MKLLGFGLAAGTSATAYSLSDEIGGFMSEEEKVADDLGEEEGLEVQGDEPTEDLADEEEPIAEEEELDEEEELEASDSDENVDHLGIPKRCKEDNNNPCELTHEELKKIKFENLGKESEEVSVTEYTGDQKITLTIRNKDYIFKNSGNTDIEIKKAGKTVVTLKGNGRTRFKSDKESLKEVKLGEYGIRVECISSKECKLSETDLEDIKFQALGETGDVSVSNLTKGKSITLKILGDKKRFIFVNDSEEDVKISKGSDSITLKGNGKTKFTVDNGKLKEFELDNYGVPKSCETNNNKTCTLEEDDLKDIKFKDFAGETDDVSVHNFENKKITLTVISKDANNTRRYIFKNESDKDVKINKGKKAITLGKKSKTKFVVDGNDLRELKLNNVGVPVDCESKICSLAKDDMEDVKFQVLGGVGTISGFESNKKISLKIVTDGTNKKRYIFSNSSGSEIKIKKSGSTDVSIKNGEKTRFTDEKGQLKQWTTGKLGLPENCKSSCILIPDDFEQIKFDGFKEGGDATLTHRHSSGERISLNIIKDGFNKDRYIFYKSSGSSLEVKKDNKTTTIAVAAKTRFSEEKGKLKKQTLGAYGLPSGCEKNCSLVQDDISQIKFSEYKGEWHIIGFPAGGKISFSVDDTGSRKKYIFENKTGSRITLQNRTTTVDLENGGKSKFMEDNGALKKIDVDFTGVPKTCTKNCSVKAENLEEFKFPGLGTQGKVTIKKGDKKEENATLDLKVEGHYKNGSKKYIFTNKGPGIVFIERGGKNLVLSVGKTRFKGFGDGFTNWSTSTYGLPSACIEGSNENKTCLLSKDDLEQVKFEKLGGDGRGTVTGMTDDENIELIIENTKNGKNFKFYKKGGSSIKIKNGSKTVEINSGALVFYSGGRDNKLSEGSVRIPGHHRTHHIFRRRRR